MFEVGISKNTYEFGNAKIFFGAESGNTDDLFESGNPEHCFNKYKFDNSEAFFSNILDDNVVTFNMFRPNNPETSFEQANNERNSEVIEYTENLSNLSSNEFISLSDINNTYENQDYDKKESELKYLIELEMSFNNWLDLDKWLNNHGIECGFVFTITYSEKDKEDRIPQHCTYKYMKGQPYVSQKEAHTINNCDRYDKLDNANLSDNDHSLEEASSSTEERKVESSSLEDEASNRQKCGICNLRGHNA
ncbi:21042_t:CDS:2, partial [Gigaspora margarita]